MTQEIPNKNEKVSNLGIRQPIVTIAGHVDSGKTSILDCFRGTCVQEKEAGGITQKISFTKYPLNKIKETCPLIEKSGIHLEIPGFLFIDTPGHAAFTNLRKRGGSLADLAVLVINIKEGIKPQTQEVLQILKTYKTPFLIALNKIDTLSGWQRKSNLRESIENQTINVQQEFQESLLTFQGSLQEHGFESDLYYEITDFTKKIAIVPCSARTKEGISELLFVLCGLCQKFLKERLKINEDAKGVILEMKKESNIEWAEAILYDGKIDIGDEIAIANFGEPIISKVRILEEIAPLSNKYKPAENVQAASGIRVQLTSKEKILSGMPFQEIKGNKQEIINLLKKEIGNNINLDKQGIIIKADSLGSLEALIFLLKQEKINIVKAEIGPINKSDMISAKTNLEINPLDAVIMGFNTYLEENVDIAKDVKVFNNEVVYKLIEDLKEWRIKKNEEIERARLLGLATICKLQIYSQYVFRNSNPAIFGVKGLSGKLKQNLSLIDENGDEISRVKSLQEDKKNVEEAEVGKEIALSLPGIAFDRKLKDSKYLYSDISERQFKSFKNNKDLLSGEELKILQEIAEIKRRKNESWGE